MFQIQWNLEKILPMGQGWSTKKFENFSSSILVKTVKIYVNFQNHAKSPISIGFTKIKFFFENFYSILINSEVSIRTFTWEQQGKFMKFAKIYDRQKFLPSQK